MLIIINMLEVAVVVLMIMVILKKKNYPVLGVAYLVGLNKFPQ